jgi:TolB-like protein
LRRSLDEYYLTSGGADALRIFIPKGSYVPAFGPAQSGQPSAARPKPAGSLDRRRGTGIVVLPFEEEGNQSAFPKFTRGFTRQLIVGLTRFADLRVFGSEETVTLGCFDNTLRFATDYDANFIPTGGTTLIETAFSVEALLVESRTGRCL